MKIKQILKKRPIKEAVRKPGVITDLAPTLRALIQNLPAPEALDRILAEITRYFTEITWSSEKEEWEQHMSREQRRQFAQKLLLSLSKSKKVAAVPPAQENEEARTASSPTDYHNRAQLDHSGNPTFACPTCNGKKKKAGMVCYKCKGTGTVPYPEYENEEEDRWPSMEEMDAISSKLYKQLKAAGWEEKYGIGLFAHPDYGTIVVDCNAAGPAKIIPSIDASYDDFIGFIKDISELDKEIIDHVTRYRRIFDPEELAGFGKFASAGAQAEAQQYDDLETLVEAEDPKPAWGKTDPLEWEDRASRGDGYAAYRLKGGKLSRAQWQEDRAIMGGGPQSEDEQQVVPPVKKPRPVHRDSDTVEVEIENPNFNEDDPNSEYYMKVEVEYTIRGFYSPSTWGYHGGEPAEHPELEVLQVYDMTTGEDIRDKLTPAQNKEIDDTLYKMNERRMNMSKRDMRRYREEP